MYCKNCGAELGDRYPVCIICRKGKGYGDKYCTFCGHEHSTPGMEVCEECGKSSVPTDPNKPVTPEHLRFSPVVAFIISAIVPGFGTAFNGQLLKGILTFIIYVFLNGFTSGPLWGLYVQGAYALVAGFDAFRIAQKLKDEQAVGRFEFF